LTLSVPDEGYTNHLTLSVPDEGYTNHLTLSVPDEGYTQMIGITFIRYTQSQMIRKPNNINVCRSKLMGLNKIANVSYSYLYLRERNFTYVIIIKVILGYNYMSFSIY
jgi:hypothetical protein